MRWSAGRSVRELPPLTADAPGVWHIRGTPVTCALCEPRETVALKGEGPGDDADIRGPACDGCGHIGRLIT